MTYPDSTSISLLSGTVIAVTALGAVAIIDIPMILIRSFGMNAFTPIYGY